MAPTTNSGNSTQGSTSTQAGNAQATAKSRRTDNKTQVPALAREKRQVVQEPVSRERAAEVALDRSVKQAVFNQDKAARSKAEKERDEARRKEIANMK